MKLIGNLKKKVDNAKTKEEARDTIKKAGMLLDDDELEKVSGGKINEPEWLDGGIIEREYVEKDSICTATQRKHDWQLQGEATFFYALCRCRLCGCYYEKRLRP